MLQILKTGHYSAVCDFSGDFAGITLFLAKKVGIEKRVASYRGWAPLYRQDPLRVAYASFMRWLVRVYATDILSNSKACFERFYPEFWENDDRFAVVYNGIPIDPFAHPFDAPGLRKELGLPSDKVIVGHVGRYDKAKNHRTILEVAKRLQDMRRNDIVFLLVGNGVPEGVSPIVDKWGLRNVICSSVRVDIPNVLRVINAFFFPSVTEGQPNALLEAMFGSLPFVASNIPSIKECVHHDANDWLVDPLDVEGACQKIILMTDNLEEFRMKAEKMRPLICDRHTASRCFGQLAECL
jgi:glycosyltransferase involved in cell wall biosynthesis